MRMIFEICIVVGAAVFVAVTTFFITVCATYDKPDGRLRIGIDRFADEYCTEMKLPIKLEVTSDTGCHSFPDSASQFVGMRFFVALGCPTAFTFDNHSPCKIEVWERARNAQENLLGSLRRFAKSESLHLVCDRLTGRRRSRAISWAGVMGLEEDATSLPEVSGSLACDNL